MEKELNQKIARLVENQVRFCVDLDEKEGKRGPVYQIKPEDAEMLGSEWIGKTVAVKEILYRQAARTILESWKNSKGFLPQIDLEVMLREQGSLKEDTLSTSAPTFTTQLMPLIRRTYAQMIGLDLVSQVPMSGPTAYMLWFDNLYDATFAADGITAGDRLDQFRPDTYAASGEQAAMRELNAQLTRATISTVNYKLLSEWTIEAEQDYRSQYKIDIAGELATQLTAEIAREIDALIIQALFGGSFYQRNWNSNGYLAGDTSTIQRRGYDATIYDAFVDCNVQIQRAIHEVANMAVCGPDTMGRLMRLETFDLDPALQGVDFTTISRRYVGTLNGYLRLYLVTDIHRINANYQNMILVLAKGADFGHSPGYFGSYIPLFLSDKYIINDDSIWGPFGSNSKLQTPLSQGKLSPVGYANPEQGSYEPCAETLHGASLRDEEKVQTTKVIEKWLAGKPVVGKSLSSLEEQ